MTRKIPDNAIYIQAGLWLNEIPITINNIDYIRYELYASDGYCFYNNTWPEDERIYWQYASLGFTNISSDYTSIPISELPENYEIA